MEAKPNSTAGDKYSNFAALAASEVVDIDYRIRVVERPESRVAIVAPHGGSIERCTSSIASALAGDDFNLYLFEGLDEAGSFEELHITSHHFDEPRCLKLVAKCDTVIAVHGCSGSDDVIMLGGLDDYLISLLEAALRPIGIPVLSSNHPYPGTRSSNICNRGRTKRGVQLELSDSLRGGSYETEIIAAIRRVLTKISRKTA